MHAWSAGHMNPATSTGVETHGSRHRPSMPCPTQTPSPHGFGPPAPGTSQRLNKVRVEVVTAAVVLVVTAVLVAVAP